MKNVTYSLKNILSLLCLGAVLLVLLAACAGNNDLPTQSTTAVSGVDGASVSYIHVKADKAQVPTVRIARDSTGAPELGADMAATGAIYQFSPLGMPASNIKLKVPLDASKLNGKAPRLIVALPGEMWHEVVDAKIEGNFMVAHVPQLSYATVVASNEPANSKSVNAGANNKLGSQALSLAPDATATTPALPAADTNGVIRVTEATSLSLKSTYQLPAGCTGIPQLRIYAAVAAIGTNGALTFKTIELARKNLTSLTGEVTVTQQLGFAEKGLWAFASAAYCTNTGARFPRYAYIATGPVINVDITTKPPLAPAITLAPQNVSVVEGASASFSVTATGANLSYQWQRSNDGGTTYANVAGATAATYSLSTALTDNGSLWRVSVSNTGGTVISTPALLTVTQLLIAPVVTTDPANQSVIEGETASFTAVGTGTPAPTYQWQSRAAANTDPQFGWANIAGATSATYTTAATTLAQSGAQFRAVLTNAAGSATTQAATLTVSARVFAPSIDIAPQAISVFAGQSGLFSVTASGTSPLSYQWFKNGVAIPGANGTEVLVLADPVDVGTSYQISVTVSNSVGTVTSVPVAMTISSGTTTVSAANGGTVVGPNNISLTIPAGALAADTAVTVTTDTLDPAVLPAGYILFGDVVNVQPAGLAFTKPVQLSVPAPASIPAGMTIALVKLIQTPTPVAPAPIVKSSSNLGITKNKAAMPTNYRSINLRRAAAAGPASAVFPGAIISNVSFPTSIACSNPQNITGDNQITKSDQSSGLTASVLVPESACATVEPRVVATGIPSKTTQKCTLDSDYIAPNGSPDNTFTDRALLSRHVDCRTSQSGVISLDVELKNTNGTYTYINPAVDTRADVTTATLGSVEFKAYASTFGPANVLNKKVSIKVQALNFVPDATYPGPNKRPSVRLRPIFQCTRATSYQGSNSFAEPRCTVTADPITVSLDGSLSAEKEYTVNFDWTADAGTVKDVLSIQFQFDSFEYAIDTASFDRLFGAPFNYSSGLSSFGIIVRCDKGVATSSNGCIFPVAAAVFDLSLTGNGAEQAQHTLEAQAKGAPGAFLLKPGYRAVADDSVAGMALTRTQIDIVRTANSFYACNSTSSIINTKPNASASCPNGGGGTTGCQCDEYPYASTYEGAWKRFANTSAKYIRAKDNQSAGGQLISILYNKERVLDLSFETTTPGTNSDPSPGFIAITGGDLFWVAIIN